MKTLSEFRAAKLEETDCDEFNEDFLKNTTKLVVANKVRTLSGQIKQEKNSLKC